MLRSETPIELLDIIWKLFKELDKAEVGNLWVLILTLDLITLVESRINIFKIVQLAKRLREVSTHMTADFIIHKAHKSLSMEFEQLKTSYNAQSEKWGSV